MPRANISFRIGTLYLFESFAGRLLASGYTLDTVIDRVADIFALTPKSIIPSSKEPTKVRARSVAAYLAVKHLKTKGTEVGRRLSLTQSAVSRAVGKAEQIADEMAISLTTG
jgi:chromosomal replication initiation ATPase DnaA